MKAQSYISDELTHFVGKALPGDEERYTLFKKILREGWLKASNRDELGPGIAMLSDGQKRLSTNKAITCTMLCFCDIPPEQFYVHIQKYGPFGLAFSKEALICQGAIPVHYVVRNARNRAVGIGVPTIGDRFDELCAELQRVQFELEEYVRSIDGAPKFLSKLSPSSTPAGHKILGRFSALENEIESFIFGQIKFFTAGLPEEHPENFYMEREWRIPDGLSFRPEDIARIIVPKDYEERFRMDVPEYAGELYLV